ncbi:MAG TPA: DUF192 domain-containing protein [Nitrospiraceae bacterium]|nr:DUF192 domain-containing protein [Nitrospiraceae bacterium]
MLPFHRYRFTHLVSTLALSLAVAPLFGMSETAAAAEFLLPIRTPSGATIQAELADTPQKRAMGLMYRESLPENHGMLFIFGEAQPWTFWMKNTRMPLDIIWLNEQKTIVHIEANTPICTRTDNDCPQYQSNEPAMYVLELAGGRAQALKLKKGMKLQFP